MNCVPTTLVIRSGTAPEDLDLMLAVSYRIREIMHTLDMNQTQFGKLLGAKPSEVSKWLSGKHNFTLKTLADIEAKTGHKVYSIPNKKV